MRVDYGQVLLELGAHQAKVVCSCRPPKVLGQACGEPFRYHRVPHARGAYEQHIRRWPGKKSGHFARVDGCFGLHERKELFRRKSKTDESVDDQEEQQYRQADKEKPPEYHAPAVPRTPAAPRTCGNVRHVPVPEIGPGQHLLPEHAGT